MINKTHNTKRSPLRRAILLPGAAVLAALAGCAPHPATRTASQPITAPQNPTPPAQTQAMATYAHAIVRQLHHDRAFNAILAQVGVSAPFAALVVVTPQGYVQKAGVAKGALPPADNAPVINHLINVNFGPFLPGMPNRPLTFEFPVHPAADAPNLADTAAFHQQTIVVYQPNPVLVARVGSAVPLAAYIKQLDASLAALFDAMPPQHGVTASLVMGVKPGLKSRAWVVTGQNHIPPALIERIKAVAEAVPPLKIQGGPIAFAIIFNVWGGGVPITDAKHPVPFPKQWYHGAPKGDFEVPDGVFARIWP
ncbi:MULTISPECIES: hypothetical protein [Acidiphilium]|uniref:Uncharacterized protein n=1 Tax=Acidiphilium rubrum TaxID=526 RepID=A0A8G2CII8_ACIRU|nr:MULTISPECIES: hypothetical protein [Acidiphilium]SIQ29108.1 hypothetical protein SAMN05421828_10399 [Acidiphilium rubrum]